MSDKERANYKMNMEGDPDKEKLLADDVKESIKALRWCDTLIFVYPTWWMNCPGLLKSWFDRSLVRRKRIDTNTKSYNNCEFTTYKITRSPVAHGRFLMRIPKVLRLVLFQSSRTLSASWGYLHTEPQCQLSHWQVIMADV